MDKNQEKLKEIAKKNFSKWNSSLQTKNPKEVARLYSEDATFLPTLSNNFEKGVSGAETYFTHFLEKNPNGEVVDEEIQVVAPDCYIYSGMYNFEVGPNSERKIVEARFTFVYKKDEQGEWKIIHHHSSLKP